MKHFYLIILLWMSVVYCTSAQTPTFPPTGCSGKTGNPSISFSGSTSFTFSSLADFSNPQSKNTLSVTISSPQPYSLYVAGEITALAGSTTNTVIPIGTFQVAASVPNGAPTVTLSNQYQEIAHNVNKNTSPQVLTITLNPTMGGTGALNTFMQAPGTHVLTLYVYLCD